MKNPSANKRGAGKGGIAVLWRARRAWPALPDRERWSNMARLLSILALLGFAGCAHVPIMAKSDVEAICNAEYEATSTRLDGRASLVSFDVQPGGTLLPKNEHRERKAAHDSKPPQGLFEAVLSLGNEFPDIGARAQTVVWTDSEYVLFTTSDEKYDVKATLLFAEGRTPFDLKELARAISNRYDGQRQLQHLLSPRGQ